MNYFKNLHGDVYAYDDDQLPYVPDGMTAMSSIEIDAHLNPRITFAQALAVLNAAYVKDRDELCAAWLRAAVADGVEESSRKEDVEAELAELDASHDKDVSALKIEYGVS